MILFKKGRWKCAASTPGVVDIETRLIRTKDKEKYFHEIRAKLRTKTMKEVGKPETITVKSLIPDYGESNYFRDHKSEWEYLREVRIQLVRQDQGNPQKESLTHSTLCPGREANHEIVISSNFMSDSAAELEKKGDCLTYGCTWYNRKDK